MNRRFATIVVLCLLGAVLVVAGQPVATSTSISFAPSAVVSSGTTVTVTASVSPTAAVGMLYIYQCYDNDPSSLTYLDPMPASYCGAGNNDQNQKKGKSRLLASGAPDGNGELSYTFPAVNESTTTAQLIGFWADFDPVPGYKPSDTAVIDLTIGPAEQLIGCTGGQTTGLQVSVKRTAGKGSVYLPPQYTGSWTFTVEVTACEDLSNVFAQGGANGWSNVDLSGLVASDGTATPWKDQRKNTVLRWTIGNMSKGQAATLDVPLTGAIKSCPATLNLSGAWSATYTNSTGVATKQLPYQPPVLINSYCQ